MGRSTGFCRASGSPPAHPAALRGSGGPVPLYSDLLLHTFSRQGPTSELGARMDPSTLFRTPPLWGVSKTAPYLHDGRAATLAEAIEVHAGEAARARGAYHDLSHEDREALLAFLQDL